MCEVYRLRNRTDRKNPSSVCFRFLSLSGHFMTGLFQDYADLSFFLLEGVTVQLLKSYSLSLQQGKK